MIIQQLKQQYNLNTPDFIPSSIVLEAIVGSEAYGCAGDFSDTDIVGICIPPEQIVFPHMNGYINGFGTPPPKFEQYQNNHIGGNHDITVYNIVKFFNLCLNNNPNIIDVLFTSRDFLSVNKIGEVIVRNRHKFLSKKCYTTFNGYAYAQLKKLNNINNKVSPKRLESIRKYGYDVKFAYHIVRLMLECEQLLGGDLILDKDNEIYTSIRNGEWKKENIINFFEIKRRELKELRDMSCLPEKPDEKKIKEILTDCLLMYYSNEE